MKTTKVQTKNGGTVTVPVYDTLAEAVKVLTEVTALKNLNRMIRVDLVNEANRKMSVTAKLKRAVKEGKISESKLLALLEPLDQ